MSPGRGSGLPWHDLNHRRIPVTLDGFVTGPGPGSDNGPGTSGQALHAWAFSDDPDERRLLVRRRPAPAPSSSAVGSSTSSTGRTDERRRHP